MAGKDITYWFNTKTREPRRCVNMATGLETYYCPLGAYLDIPSIYPDSGVGQKLTTLP